MNLEHVSAGKTTYSRSKFHVQPIQLPIFPKIALIPDYRLSIRNIERVMGRMAVNELIGSQMVRDYLRRQLRHNCRPNTIRASGTTIVLFLVFFKQSGGNHLSAIGTEHISAFIEYEQDRGMSAVTIDTRLKALYAFLNFLVSREVIDTNVIKRKLRIKLPDALPRAIDPDDIRQLLAVIKKVRDRALILMLLRTGMRIGELLSTRVQDLNLRDKWLQIIEAHKNRVGRVVYLTDDAVSTLRKWLRTRKYPSKFVFYGNDTGPLCYEAARAMFMHYLDKAGLARKGYTLHCLRHTFASELLNAGMPLQCLQELLGHRSVDITRRYARLTDNTRRQAYHRAMAIIEAGEIHGHYQLDYQLP